MGEPAAAGSRFDDHGGGDHVDGSGPQGHDKPEQRPHNRQHPHHRTHRSCGGSARTGRTQGAYSRSRGITSTSTSSSSSSTSTSTSTSTSSAGTSTPARARPGSGARPGRCTAARAGRLAAAGDHDETVGEEVSAVVHDHVTRPLTRRTFDAMGCTFELILDGAAPHTEEALTAAESEIHRLERMLSRFLPTSELSLLNATGALEAPPELVEVTQLALDARERTGGRFDPTVHDAVVAAGYDRSFEEIAPDGLAISPGAACGGGVSVTGSTIEIEPGYRLDLGGIAKGYAADRVCALLGTVAPCVVNAGGDIAIHGTTEQGVWPVAVEVPGEPLTLGLGSGALATSGRDHRRWRRGGIELHHLVDPATGLPAVTSLLRVTAFAESAAGAEVAAKVLLLAGERAARIEAEALGIPAVLVTVDGRVELVGGLA